MVKPLKNQLNAIVLSNMLSTSEVQIICQFPWEIPKENGLFMDVYTGPKCLHPAMG